MRLSTPIRVALLSAWLATSATPLGAQPKVKELSADALCRTTLKAGDAVSVTGRYKELIDDELYLFDCNLPLILTHHRLFGQILNFTPKQDNLTVIGVVDEFGDEFVVQVRELKRAPGDYAIFRREYVKLKEAPPEEQADELTYLGRRIAEASRRQESRQLLLLARKVFTDALSHQNGASQTIDERIDRIRTVHHSLQDEAFVRDLVLPMLEEETTRQPALEFLRELGCRQHKGRWLTHGEYNQLEGLVEHDGRWITPRELHHIRALEQFAGQPKNNLPLLRRRTEREYILVAESGRVEPGMRREEVCLALGFPDIVLRRAYKRKEFDQWSYGTNYYYFYDGTLVFLPQK